MRRERSEHTGDWTFTLGHEELVVHQRYEVLSIANDLMIGFWFVVGSFCFFYDGPIMELGTWLFVLGSVQLLIRPLIRLHRFVRLKRLPDSTQDY